MSCHRSQKSIMLHHRQIAGGKERREQRHADRQQRWFMTRQNALRELLVIRVMGVFCFVYIAFLVAAHLGYMVADLYSGVSSAGW